MEGNGRRDIGREVRHGGFSREWMLLNDGCLVTDSRPDSVVARQFDLAGNNTMNPGASTGRSPW